jgi:hypothetical protein
MGAIVTARGLVVLILQVSRKTLPAWKKRNEVREWMAEARFDGTAAARGARAAGAIVRRIEARRGER